MNKNNISTIIPTYKEPDFLDLAIYSLINGQDNQNNQIVIVVDGTYEINKFILDKWKTKIDVIVFEQNYGLSKATNYGVYNSKYDNIFIINSDNVAPKHWDTLLLKDFESNDVLTPNQIEPYDSMFKQFIKHDFGRNTKDFNYDCFIKKSEDEFRKDIIELTGSTLPFLIKKQNFLKIGGWSEEYPSNTGQVVDWEWFLKCELCGLVMKRTYNCHFYHFVSTSTITQEQMKQKQKIEQECFDFFKYKWGRYPSHNLQTNSKRFTD